MKKLPKSVREEDFPKIIRATPTKDKAARTAFLLAYGSGLRISEVLSLTPKCVQNGFIDVVDGKGGKDRTVPKPKGWREYMKGLLPLSQHFSVRTLQRKFANARDKAGLDGSLTFHGLRHGFATRLVERGVPPNQVQLLMGHSDFSTTAIYFKARPMDALKSYEELF